MRETVSSQVRISAFRLGGCVQSAFGSADIGGRELLGLGSMTLYNVTKLVPSALVISWLEILLNGEFYSTAQRKKQNRCQTLVGIAFAIENKMKYSLGIESSEMVWDLWIETNSTGS
jgi:hypothetical protein